MYTIVGVVDTVFWTAQNKVEYWNSNTWLKELVMSTDVQGFPYCERRNTQLKKWKLAYDSRTVVSKWNVKWYGTVLKLIQGERQKWL